MTVDAPAFYALLPIGDTWVVEGGMVYDAMSGASPLYFNVLSGASIGDYRTAGDLKVTKYFGDHAVSFGGFVSSEQDFLSRGGSVNVQIFSDDRNRTWLLGVAGTNDRINATNGVAPNSPRNSLEFVVGVTQALSANSIVQSNLTYYTGHGYYSRSVQAARHAADDARDVRMAHALQPVFPGPGWHAEAGLPAAVRFVRQHVEHARGRVGAGVAVGLHGDAGSALLHADRRRFLHESAVPEGLRGEGLTITAPTRGSRRSVRITAGVIVGKTLWDGWIVSLRADYYRQDPDWRSSAPAVRASRPSPPAGSRSTSPRPSDGRTAIVSDASDLASRVCGLKPALHPMHRDRG